MASGAGCCPPAPGPRGCRRAAAVLAAALAVPPLGTLAAVVLAAACRAWVVGRAAAHVTTAVPPAGAVPAVGVVLGAGLRPDGTPTALLAQRVAGAVQLHRAGVVGRLVMSGHTESDGRDQPAAMAALARSLGVADEHLVLDRRGVDTAATCRELKARPDVAAGAPVVLVTQEFHIHRAVYLARKAGLAAFGYALPDADVRPAALARARSREIPAAVKAVLLDRP
ncbi:MAG: YdcF family protein [Acidimicrobiia bacterium]|nr:YdcF family protein [Acidimicrobiia bacterium]